MIGTRIPRFFLYATTLGVVVAIVMLTLFYGQYRWLARQIVDASFAEHRALLEASYEQRARAELHRIADLLPAALESGDAVDVSRILNRGLSENPALNGLRLTMADELTHSSGNFPETAGVDNPAWLEEQLLLSLAVRHDGVEVGQLAGSFDLAPLRADLDRFAAELGSREDQSRRISYLWIGGGTIAVLLLCGGIVWLLVRGQTRRIRQLKAQAERFRDADFGEPLPATREDELGALAQVFNDMRDKLRTTTHSRDYVDGILSGMNEAIIVTDDAGQISRVNRATTHLLGYEQDELKGTSIDFVINKEKSHSLAKDTPSGLPREAIFESKYGESIPVSYTCSIVETGSDGAANRIYAAQNITERRRAEKRIRYLARIDALTKIPNRMQFQHLLQRGIARARRAGKAALPVLCRCRSLQGNQRHLRPSRGRYNA